MCLDAAGISKIGSREVNEDSIHITLSGPVSLFAAADGLGGHGGGDIASTIALEQARMAFFTGDGDIPSRMERCFNNAQEAIAKQTRHGMTTLAVLAVTQEFKARWAHVGDSRVYYFPAHRPRRYVRTLDHSVTQSLATRGMIKEKEIRFHEDRSMLIRALGDKAHSPDFDLSEEISLRQGDALLLCTDGFWEWVPEKTMIKLFKRAKRAEEWLGKMEQELLRSGANKDIDNYSAIAVILR